MKTKKPTVESLKAERDALKVSVRLGLLAMKSVQPVVADNAPHAYVMAYNAAIEAFEDLTK